LVLGFDRVAYLEPKFHEEEIEERIELRREGNRPRLPGSGDIGDRSRKISHITYSVSAASRARLARSSGSAALAAPLHQVPCVPRIVEYSDSLLWTHGTSRYRVVMCVIFLGGFRLVFPRHPWRGKS